MSGAIAIIPARGGSWRIPRKNIRRFAGAPMIQHSIAAAVMSRLFERVVVSTDDDEIAAVSQELGAQVVRRPKCDGSMGTQDVARLVLESEEMSPHLAEVNTACVIYATCPLLLPADLKRGYEALLSNGDHQFAMGVGTEPLADAGAFYWGRTTAFLERKPLIASHTVMVPLPPERVCDINTEEDWNRALGLYQQLQAQRSRA